MTLAKVTAMQLSGVTFALDYRLPPDHRFPCRLTIALPSIVIR